VILGRIETILKQIVKWCIVFCLLISSFPLFVSALPQSYSYQNSYEYNSYEESVESPVGYEAVGLFTGKDMGTTALSEPQDMLFTEDGQIYLLDSGNGRILILDKELKLIREIKEFFHNGKKVKFAGAQGIFLSEDGFLYLADTLNERVLIIDSKGKVQSIIKKPDSELISEETVFSPRKVIHDTNDITYVLVSGITDGALSFDKDNSFIGFYGSNRIKVTAEVLADYLWNKFMTEAQILSSQSRVPAQFSNFDIDEKQFIYTVTGTNDTSSNYRKLNFKGTDLLSTESLGDFELDGYEDEEKVTNFIDVDVDKEGFVNLLDQTMGRVFQYSSKCDLVTIFGGSDSKVGNFQAPVAVESYDGKVYVLDSIQNAVTVFEPTPYTEAKRKAISLYEKGEYKESAKYWNKVIAMNSNSEIAYGGLAKVYEESGQYEKAMQYYKLANEREGYSSSFKEVRKEALKENFVFIFLGIILIAGGIIILRLKSKKKRRALQSIGSLPTVSRAALPFFMLFHPIDCSDEFIKRKKQGSYRAAILILAFLFIGLSVSWFSTGFLFNEKKPEDFNVFIILIQAFGIYLMWCVANWAVCTLIEGKGSFKEIASSTAYGLIPGILAIYIKIIMSNVLLLTESGFITLIMFIGIAWSGVLILVGLATVHQFSFGKLVASVLLTLLFILIVLFVLTLFYGLAEQVVSFVKLIYSEIQMMK